MGAMNPDDYQPLVKLALREDLGDRGDVTSNAIFSNETSRAVLVSKDTGVLAGAEVFSAVYREVDPTVAVEFKLKDGDYVKPGDTVAVVNGPVVSILTGERTAINFISFLSGIATATKRFVESAAASGKAVILDTRKTLPGFRNLSKYAVRAGGGRNHRIGLYDMVLIKDNHIDFSGSITRAVEQVRSKWGNEFRIEVECRTLDEVKEALVCHVDVIMLDNMKAEEVRTAVTMRSGIGYGHSEDAGVEFETSGNMNIETTGIMSHAGVDYISVGSLTHSVKSFDFSLKTEVL